MPSTGSVQQTGKNSWKLTVSGGFDGSGKRVRLTKTVRVTGGTDEAQRKQAEYQLSLFIADIKNGQTAHSGKMTLKQFYDYWKENYALKNHQPATLAYNDNLFARIEKSLGSKRLDKLEPRNLLAFYKNLAEPGIKTIQQKKGTTEPAPVKCLSANTIKKHHVLLSSLLAKAVQWNFIPYNPGERVEPPKAERHQKQIYDTETTGRFLMHLEKEELKHRVMAILCLSTGIRRGELFGLQWKHIDLDKGIIRIDQANQYLPGKGIFTKAPKTEGSKRIITIPASICVLLKQHKTKQSAKRLKLGGTGEGGKWKGTEDPEDNFVFTAWNGQPAHPDSMDAWLKKFTQENDLPPISAHSFRHMSATYLIAGGTDIRTVSGKLGHSQTSTTMNIYAHLLKSAEAETASTMENILQQATDKAKQAQKKQAK